MNRRTGFTLIEMLIALGLMGILTALALAPVVVTVRRVVSAQNSSAGMLALERAAAFIDRELAGTIRLAKTAVIVEDAQELGGSEDDILIFMTASPSRQQLAAGSVVYKLEHGGPLSETPAGLYRWHFPGVMPEDVDAKSLRGTDGQMVLPGVTAFSVEVPDGTERRKEYKGELPVGICVGMTRGEKGEEEGFEDTFVFP